MERFRNAFRSPAVRIIDDGHVEALRTAPAAKVWLPLRGQVFAKIPPAKGNRRWLMAAVQVRSPVLAESGWRLPRNCLTKLVTAAVDRYGYVELFRDMSKLSRCTRACLEAVGAECDCLCLGLHHGQDSSGWFEPAGDATVVADWGEIKRIRIVYGARGEIGDPVSYAGELSGRRYRSDRASRLDWPSASLFICACCFTARAQVWDHCHAHGFVRGPLCNGCNTRRWSGWRPERGRAAPSVNVDTSYYRWCPQYDNELPECSS